jgi:hypothetical protein
LSLMFMRVPKISPYMRFSIASLHGSYQFKLHRWQMNFEAVPSSKVSPPYPI